VIPVEPVVNCMPL
jgi:hypothetical protein